MGSSLGLPIADFYMFELEKIFFSEPDECNPVYHIKRVDDNLTIFKNKSSVDNFRNKLGNTSMLDFIHEENWKEHFQFMDVKPSKTLNGSLTTNRLTAVSTPTLRPIRTSITRRLSSKL